MNWKEYKVWRIAPYCYEENTIWIPEGVKFYCFNKERADGYWEAHDKNDTFAKYPNYHMIAIVPYNEEIEMSSAHMHYNICGTKDKFPRIQGFVLHTYNINNEWIVWDMPECYPLSEDFPVTDVMPTFGEHGLCFKRRLPEIQFNKMALVEGLSYIDNNENLIKEEKELVIEDKYMPVSSYIKINGFNSNGQVDITKISAATWVRGEKINIIERCYLDTTSTFVEDRFTKIDKCTSDEFAKVFALYSNALLSTNSFTDTFNDIMKGMYGDKLYDVFIELEKIDNKYNN